MTCIYFESDWLSAFPVWFVIGQSEHFGFGFAALDWKPLYQTGVINHLKWLKRDFHVNSVFIIIEILLAGLASQVADCSLDGGPITQLILSLQGKLTDLVVLPELYTYTETSLCFLRSIIFLVAQQQRTRVCFPVWVLVRGRSTCFLFLVSQLLLIFKER